MAHWLRLLDAHLEDPSSGPSIHVRWLIAACNSNFKGIWYLFMASKALSPPIKTKRILKKMEPSTWSHAVGHVLAALLFFWCPVLVWCWLGKQAGVNCRWYQAFTLQLYAGEDWGVVAPSPWTIQEVKCMQSCVQRRLSFLTQLSHREHRKSTRQLQC